MKTIVCIEDNFLNLRLMQEVIKRRGHWNLMCADTGELGLSLIRKVKPNLVLMDIGLPDIDGYEVLARLHREFGREDAPPVIAVTSYAMPLQIEQGIAAGFLHYVTKPLEVKQFLSLLDRVLA